MPLSKATPTLEEDQWEDNQSKHGITQEQIIIQILGSEESSNSGHCELGVRSVTLEYAFLEEVSTLR